MTDLYENLLQNFDKKAYILCGFLISKKSIWVSESLYIAEKTEHYGAGGNAFKINTVVSFRQ